MMDTHDTNLPEKPVELEEEKKTAEVSEPATTETPAEEIVSEKPVEQAVQVKVAEGKKNDYKERKERESTLRKLSGALKRCEQAIDEIGLKTAELAQQMSQPEIATDYEKTSALAQEIEALKEKEESLTAEWMELSEQIEAFT